MFTSYYALDIVISVVLIVLYGLISLRGFKDLNLSVAHSMCQCVPLLSVMLLVSESYGTSPMESLCSSSYDIALAVITVVEIRSMKNLESMLLMLMAYVAQAFMIHSCDLLSFYVCLEAQTFTFIILCGLHAFETKGKLTHSFAVEASIKYLILSAFSSGVLLFSIASLYISTGSTSIYALEGNYTFLILLALLFKLGSAPLHLWVVNIYQSISRPLLMYISTAPKLSLFAFWASAWELAWTEYTLSLFMVYTLVLGSFGAYGFSSQPAVRILLAYSTISEIGYMLLATETAGFHTLFQHLSIYIISQVLVWNLSDKRLFALVAISLAGIPPLAGFFGKAWIFWHAVNLHMISLLLIALACTVLSIIYYLRLFRLFWNIGPSLNSGTSSLLTLMYGTTGYRAIGITANSYHVSSSLSGVSLIKNSDIALTSACFVSLVFLPIFFIKPFIL